MNKICTLVGRSEVRDIWDIYHFVQRGHNLRQGIELANLKDGGVDLESVILVLSSLNWKALSRAAERADYRDWQEVESFYKQQREELAMKLLPGDES